MPHATHDRLRAVTSRQNSLVKDLRRAFSEGEPTKDGSIAVEGMHLLEEAIRSGVRFQAVFFAESARARADRLLPQIGAHVEILLLPEDVFASAVSTGTPQGVAALVRVKAFDLNDVLAGESPLVICCAGIQDPGNLGTIIRSAEAFGAAGVIIGDKTVSPYNPKVVRASAGSIFRLPLVRAATADVLKELRSRSVKLLATSSHKGTPLPDVDLTGPAAVFIGSEGSGLPREVMSAIDESILIPHSEKVESLNAGIAAAIVLYEASRQRKLTIEEN